VLEVLKVLYRNFISLDLFDFRIACLCLCVSLSVCVCVDSD